SVANAINDLGTIVGGFTSGSCNGTPVIWTGFIGQPLPTPPGALVAIGINGSGVICGNGVPLPGPTKAGWILDGAVFQWIISPSGFDLEVTGINARNQVCGQSSTASGTNPPTVAFVWKDGVFTPLPPLTGHLSSRAVDINGDGTVLGALR